MEAEKSEFFEQMFKDAEKTKEFWVAGMELEVSEAITRALAMRNITPAALSRLLGTQRSGLCRIMKGKQNLTLDTIAKIFLAMGFGVNISLEIKDLQK